MRREAPPRSPPIACSRYASRDAASRRASSRPIPIPSHVGQPGAAEGERPRLVEQTHRTPAACSRTSPPRTRIPRACAEVVPARTASGVASPRAHGQAMTSTEIPAISAALGRDPSRRPRKTVPAAMRRIAGTKKRTTRSAARWIGAFRACASSTAWTTRDRTVSPPVRTTRTRRRPVPFNDPATTGSPAVSTRGPTPRSASTRPPQNSLRSLSRPPASAPRGRSPRDPRERGKRRGVERFAAGSRLRAITGASRTSLEIPSAARDRALPPRCTGQEDQGQDHRRRVEITPPPEEQGRGTVPYAEKAPRKTRASSRTPRGALRGGRRGRTALRSRRRPEWRGGNRATGIAARTARRSLEVPGVEPRGEEHHLHREERRGPEAQQQVRRFPSKGLSAGGAIRGVRRVPERADRQDDVSDGGSDGFQEIRACRLRN